MASNRGSVQGPQSPPAARRCTRCVMPASVPGSGFDAEGVCTWCRQGFPNYKPLGIERLRLVLAPFQRRGTGPDCLVAVSGGKDSSFSLLTLVRDFGLRVEAFTYVHDGLNAFALANARAVCAGLGVPHRTVSLDEHQHLESFKDYFGAWTASKAPVAAAMSCVACKHMHAMGARLAHARGIPLVVWSSCPLEVPPFIPSRPGGGEDASADGILGMGMKLARVLAQDAGFRRAFLRHVSLSVKGCLVFRPGTVLVQRLYPSVSHLQFFDYFPWDGRRMTETLRHQTAWSVPEALPTDWHADCLFDVFKEYMFQSMFGASYLDAYLSNQIRHGLVTRADAMDELVRSKQYLAAELPRALRVLGLQHLQEACDPSCFTRSLEGEPQPGSAAVPSAAVSARTA